MNKSVAGFALAINAGNIKRKDCAIWCSVVTPYENPHFTD
jgi:hypothetical protein